MFLSKRSNGLYYLWFLGDGGKRQKVSTGCRLKADAIKFLREFKQNEVQRRTEISRKTLRIFFQDYLAYSQGVHTPKTRHSIGNAFRELIRIVGDMRLDALGVRDIERFLAQKKEEASEWTARKYYIHLASAFETAKRWNYLTDNPFRKIQKPKTREVQPAFFAMADIQILLKTIEDEQYRNICLVGLYTGMRLGEILNLQWSDVDLVSRTIHVQNSLEFTTKTKRNRTLPIGDQLSVLLSEMKERASSELVFHRRGKRLIVNDISREFKPIVRKAGLNDRLHFHSLRHTFATWLVQGGVNIYEVQKLLGHSSVKVTEVYSHLAASELHASVNKIQLQ